jgi:hypothetical protein
MRIAKQKVRMRWLAGMLFCDKQLVVLNTSGLFWFANVYFGLQKKCLGKGKKSPQAKRKN